MTSRQAGSAATAFATAAGDSASPPDSSWPSGARPVTFASTIWWNRPAVRNSDVTPSAASTSPSSSGEGTRRGSITSLAPFSSAPQISSVEASNAAGASCSQTSCGPKRAYSVPSTSRATPRWTTATPLGSPLDPEVYIT